MECQLRDMTAGTSRNEERSAQRNFVIAECSQTLLDPPNPSRGCDYASDHLLRCVHRRANFELTYLCVSHRGQPVERSAVPPTTVGFLPIRSGLFAQVLKRLDCPIAGLFGTFSCNSLGNGLNRYSRSCERGVGALALTLTHRKGPSALPSPEMCTGSSGAKCRTPS